VTGRGFQGAGSKRDCVLKCRGGGEWDVILEGGVQRML
jgi:hypothetical protein